ncbi:zinc ribbon domain-containing protein [Vibrio atypicus]|uniref:zinc ribbon domain-containing protein n=1 Tax=Vibrio atypicus TaxID=558271 RepID=UPI001359DD07|nr:zinc ribbon domain-containing protein [Vibrio atypicus]
MNENHCPECQQELEWQGHYHCSQCDEGYKKVGFCPDCDTALEKLQACGAASYFCNSCNELKSKSRVRFEFQKISEQ